MDQTKQTKLDAMLKRIASQPTKTLPDVAVDPRSPSQQVNDLLNN